MDCVTDVVCTVDRLTKFSIAGVMVPAAPNRFKGTQPLVLTVQVTAFVARKACCTLENEPQLTRAPTWSDDPRCR